MTNIAIAHRNIFESALVDSPFNYEILDALNLAASGIISSYATSIISCITLTYTSYGNRELPVNTCLKIGLGNLLKSLRISSLAATTLFLSGNYKIKFSEHKSDNKKSINKKTYNSFLLATYTISAHQIFQNIAICRSAQNIARLAITDFSAFNPTLKLGIIGETHAYAMGLIIGYLL